MQMKRLCALVVLWCLALAFLACGSASTPCGTATNKQIDCWKSLDCSTLGATEAEKCNTDKEAQLKSLELSLKLQANSDPKLQLACEGAVLTSAQEINQCELQTDLSSPASTCRCKK